MTRIEQIQKEAARFTAVTGDFGYTEDIEDAFIQGAKWADTTLLDKACKWWKDNWMFGSEEIGTEHRDFMIEQFRKAMEQ